MNKVTIIDGKAIAAKLEKDLTEKLAASHKKPGLAFVLVGNNAASRSYVSMKKKACARIGILSIDKEFPETISEAHLTEEINWLNRDPAVHGILVQLPLPSHISTTNIMEAVNPQKDVDGFHPINVGKMLLGETDGFLPCTPKGVVVLLASANIPVEGKHVVIVGRSNIVGKPLAAILMQKAPHCNATVTVANSYTKNLKEICKSADILIAAIGSPKFITKDMVKPGSVVIDVGINRVNNLIIGDVDFENVAPITSHITPVPGGVGPMTIAMLMSNLLRSVS